MNSISVTNAPPPARFELDDDGSLFTITLARPKANILDTPMVVAIREAIARQAENPALRAILFTHDGPNFSYGASVDEHREEKVRGMFTIFHGLFRDLVALRVPLISAVRGHCLGGGLELATFCNRCIATPDATLGSPEILLGVFAPMASITIPLRVGQGAADDLLLTGRSVRGDEALAIGLVDALDHDPAAAARSWYQKHLRPLSASSLRFALAASRHRLHEDIETRLARLEQTYLDELMSTADASEGIAAFLNKRQAQWRHR
ncbi:MAG: enoyl-CoA hydratase/isomerase family protein [Planctomycetes bacterium]|nr:enoyl-CoA hydratase/isomerase family protein [Planctomycetota bacterium]